MQRRTWSGPWSWTASAHRSARRLGYRPALEVLETRCLPGFVAAGNEFLVNQTTAGNQSVASARALAAAADGRFVVAWVSSDGSASGVYARVYNADGGERTAELLVNQFT